MEREKKNEKNISKESLIQGYMEQVLEQGEAPKSIYKFAKDHQFSETDFYAHFGSFEALRLEIWNEFHQQSISLMNKSEEVTSYSTREKLLAFFFTFFEVLTANRSYVLIVLDGCQKSLRNFSQLKALRKNIKDFSKELIRENNENRSQNILKQNETIFSEAIWGQTLFLLKFWMNDNSPKFEKTDMAIEKSVNTGFDVFDSAPLERMVDFGKFLWKEKMV